MSDCARVQIVSRSCLSEMQSCLCQDAVFLLVRREIGPGPILRHLHNLIKIKGEIPLRGAAETSGYVEINVNYLGKLLRTRVGECIHEFFVDES